MTQSMRDRLAEALKTHLINERERVVYDAPYVSGDDVKDMCLDGYFDLTKMVDAILSEMERPSASVCSVKPLGLSEVCSEWVFSAMIRAIREGA